MTLIKLEEAFEEVKKLPLSEYLVLPIKAKVEDYKEKIKKLKFPLWLKLNTGEHKSKINAIEECHNFKELGKKYSKLKKQFPNKKIIIQENTDGVEILAGIKQDKTFGKILLIGSGGILTEIKKDTEFRILPATKKEIREAIKQLKVYKLLKGKKYKIKRLVKVIKKFSDIAIKKDIKDADLNPIIIGKDVRVVDARISL